VASLAPRTPPVAAAQPRPGVLPFAGEAGHSVIGGLLGGLGLLSVGAALRMRGRRVAAEQGGPAGGAAPAAADASTIREDPPVQP